MLAIGRDDGIIGRERLHDADRHRLLAVVEVQKAEDLLRLVQLDAFRLEMPDADHLAQQHGAGARGRAGPWRRYRRSSLVAFEGGQIAFRQAEFARLEQPAHDLAAAGLRQVGAEVDFLRRHGRAEPPAGVPSRSRRKSSDGTKPGFSATNALTISPAIGSGLPITPASATAGCSISALSTSNGPIRCPEDLMTSSARPTNQKYPSASRFARSPVRYQRPGEAFPVALVLVQIAAEHRRPAGLKRQFAFDHRARRPPSPTPSAPRWTIAASMPGSGRPIDPGLTRQRRHSWRS